MTSVQYWHFPTFTEATEVRKGERRHAEKLVEKAAEDGIITEAEQDEIMSELRVSAGVVRDVYLEAVEKLGRGAQAPVGLDPLVERMERRDAILDETSRWGDELVRAAGNGELSEKEREALVASFLTLSESAKKAVMAILPRYGVAGAPELVSEINVALARAGGSRLLR
ncbi:MAG: hypothetical protein ACAI38_13850 [Myxococcota bacterium]|nr:hypothetical protein [Myxococcota bacterium]